MPAEPSPLDVVESKPAGIVVDETSDASDVDHVDQVSDSVAR
jgi:hypothetical protein